MSATPQAISPTENGFTAVNGSRGSPTQSSRASDTMSVRPVTADSQSRAHTAANGENLYHHHHVSPMNGSVKRKRPEEEGDQGDSMLVDEDESDSEEDTPSAVEYGQRSDGNARDVSDTFTDIESWNSSVMPVGILVAEKHQVRQLYCGGDQERLNVFGRRIECEVICYLVGFP